MSDRLVWGQLAVDHGTAYWTEVPSPDEPLHSLWRKPIAGGEPQLVWKGPTGIFGKGLAVVDGFVYWSGQIGDFPTELAARDPATGLTKNGVFVVFAGGGEARLLGVMGLCAAYTGIAAADMRVFAGSLGCEYDGGSVLYGVGTQRGGWTSRTWESTQYHLNWFALHGTLIYLATDGAVLSVRTTGLNDTQELAAVPAQGIAVDDTHVFITSGSTVRSIERFGANTVTTLADGLEGAHQIALDETSVYVVAGASATLDGGLPHSSLYRVSKAGGDLEPLVADMGDAYELVVDDSGVTWSAFVSPAPLRGGGVFHLACK